MCEIASFKVLELYSDRHKKCNQIWQCVTRVTETVTSSLVKIYRRIYGTSQHLLGKYSCWRR